MNRTYENFMKERTIKSNSHRVHLKGEKRYFNVEAADVEAEKKMGSEYKKIATCKSCYLKHNGECY